MNRDYEVFYNGLRGLTNAEALSEIIGKLELLAKKRRENNRATILEERLKTLLDKMRDSTRDEMFVSDEVFKRNK